MVLSNQFTYHMATNIYDPTGVPIAHFSIVDVHWLPKPPAEVPELWEGVCLAPQFRGLRMTQGISWKSTAVLSRPPLLPHVRGHHWLED
jgi:hypothetical protein